MASASYFNERNGPTSDLLSPSTSTTASAPRSSALSSRITNVLSASYADLDLRDALETLDSRNFQNTQESRRNLRLDLQQEVIKSNGEIIQDFGQVAEVRTSHSVSGSLEGHQSQSLAGPELRYNLESSCTRILRYRFNATTTFCQKEVSH